MKSYIPYSLLAAIASCGLAVGAETAYTTPVGYMTVSIPAGGTTASPKLQLANQGLLPGGGPAYAGVAEAFGVDGTGNFVQDDQGTWAANDYVNGALASHVVEVTSGPMTGSMSFVTSSVANKLYTADNLSGAGAGATFKVWKTFTIASLLGDPPLPSVMGGGTSVTSADNLQILDPISNKYQTFWYKNAGVGGVGWRSTGVPNADVPATAIFPNDGLVVLRKQASPGSLVIAGAVKPGVTDVRVEGSASKTVLNIIANQVPVDQITFGTSNLYTGNDVTGVKGGTSVTSADNVLLFDADQNKYKIFWYKNAGVGGTGWRATGVADATAFVIPSTGAVLINRKSGPAFSWKIQGVNISQ